MYSLLSFLIVCGSADSIEPSTSVSINLNEPSLIDFSKNISIGEFGPYRLNNDNFSNVSPKLYRKTFWLLADAWTKIRNFFKKSDKKKTENAKEEDAKEEDVKEGDEKNDAEIDGKINADWLEYFNEIGEFYELLKQDKYAEILKKVDRLTKDVDVLIVTDHDIRVRSKTIDELMQGMNLLARRKDSLIVFNGKVFKGDVNIANNDDSSKGSVDDMWLRFFRKLHKAYTLFKQGKFLESRKTMKKIMISYAINIMKVTNGLLTIRASSRRLIKGTYLNFDSEKVIVHNKYLRYKQNGVFTEAGGPVFFNGEKISKSSKKIFSINTIHISRTVFINNLQIEQGKFYDF